MVRLAFGLGLAVGLSACTCAQTHSVDSGMDAVSAPVPDAARDGAVDTRFPIDFVGDAGCERVYGYRVCGERCLAPCAGSEGRCSSLGVCYGARGSDVGYGCHYNEFGGAYCGDGRICAPTEGRFDSSDLTTDVLSGTCIDPAFCALLPSAGLESSQCQYSDGTLFVTGPPRLDDCPTSHPVFQFCGGPCLEVICPEVGGVRRQRTCAGISGSPPGLVGLKQRFTHDVARA